MKSPFPNFLTFTHPSEEYCKNCIQVVVRGPCIRKENIVLTLNHDDPILKMIYGNALTLCRKTRQPQKEKFSKFKLYKIYKRKKSQSIVSLKISKDEFKDRLVELITSSKNEWEISYLKDILRRFSKQKSEKFE